MSYGKVNCSVCKREVIQMTEWRADEFTGRGNWAHWWVHRIDGSPRCENAESEWDQSEIDKGMEELRRYGMRGL